MSRSPNGKAIPPFMMCLPEASRRLGTLEQMKHFFEILEEMTNQLDQRLVKVFKEVLEGHGSL